MTAFFENSTIFLYVKKVTDYISSKWNESQIGWFVTRNMNDNKSKNSLFYSIVNFLISKTFSINIGGTFGDKIKESCILNLVSHYEIGVFLMLLTAPIIPTMACVAIAVFTIISFFINSIVVFLL